jgi:hypothetical protein
MQYAFDVGHLFVTPSVGASPVRVGSLRGVQIDIERSLTLERLAFQVPVKAAHRETRLKGRAKMATINGAIFAELFFGKATTPGSTKGVDGCPQTIPGSPYQLQITPPAGGTFYMDLGVLFASNAVPQELTRVSGSPGANEYSLSGDTYTFSSADTGKEILVSYAYTVSTGKRLTITNPYWIEAPTFKVAGFIPYGGKQLFMEFPGCVSEHLSIATVLENWTIPDFTFEVISPDGVQVGILSTAE